MPSYSGVWTLSAVVQAIGAQTWPSYIDASTRAVFAASGTNSNSLSYINITEPGDSVDFGDLLYNDTYAASGCGSSTRGLFAGGTSGGGPVATNSINFITMATTGNAQDFGDLTYARTQGGGLSNSTRGVFIIGWQNGAGTTNIIDYVAMASAGNAVDFGDANNAYYGIGANQGASSTRGIFAGGYVSGSASATRAIYYLEIATTGNSSSFGDLSNLTQLGTGCSSSTRALYVGGSSWPDFISLNVIDYMTIASTGNATDFGDMTTGSIRGAAVSSSTRGVFARNSNIIDYVTIATTGNATDFGDLVGTSDTCGGASNCHGGL
jgi:hypothetical protein